MVDDKLNTKRGDSESPSPVSSATPTSVKALRGQRIARAIRDSGYSQREIADLIGVTPQSITKWIKSGNIYIDNLQRLSELTGRDIAYFIAMTDNKNGIQEPGRTYQTNSEILLDLAQKLSEKQLEKVIVFANALLACESDSIKISVQADADTE